MKPVVLFILILVIEENDAAVASEETFQDWAHIVLVGTGASFMILCPILVLALFRCCEKKKSDSLTTVEVEAQLASSPTPVLVRENTVCDENEAECDSPIYCEAKDIFEFPRREQHSETTNTTGETIETDIHTPVGSEADSEYQYCYSPAVDDVYENMNGTRPDSEEYSFAYDHLNADYVNTFPRRVKSGTHDDYEYPHYNRNSSECEYRYAYDWWTPSFKESTLTSSASEPVLEYCSIDRDVMDENCYVNHETLSKENIEDENETVVLEYVTIL